MERDPQVIVAARPLEVGRAGCFAEDRLRRMARQKTCSGQLDRRQHGKIVGACRNHGIRDISAKGRHRMHWSSPHAQATSAANSSIRTVGTNQRLRDFRAEYGAFSTSCPFGRNAERLPPRDSDHVVVSGRGVVDQSTPLGRRAPCVVSVVPRPLRVQSGVPRCGSVGDASPVSARDVELFPRFLVRTTPGNNQNNARDVSRTPLYALESS